MSENKRYYWLKLKDDFFRNKKIKKLRKIAGGDTYTIIYLKMQLLSLKNNGILYFDEVEDTFEEEIALEIDESVEDVKMTIMFLNNNGLIEQINEDEFKMLETVECIGSETASTIRSRRHRALQNEQKALQCNSNATICNGEIDIEIDIEKEKDVATAEVVKCYEENIGMFTPATAEIILSYLEDLPKEMVIKAIKIASVNNKKNGKYIEGILRSWINKGFKTLLDVEQETMRNKPQETICDFPKEKIYDLFDN